MNNHPATACMLLSAILLTNVSSVVAGSDPASSNACPTDINRSGITDYDDYVLLIAQLNQPCTTSACATDLDYNGITSISDFLILVGKYNQSCPITPKIFFDLSKAVYADGFVEIPVSISTNVAVHSMSFKMSFNEPKLSFDSIVIHESYFESFFYFHPVDRKIRGGGYGFTNIGGTASFPNLEMNKPIFSIKFKMNEFNVSEQDFFSLWGIMDDIVAPVEFDSSNLWN